MNGHPPSSLNYNQRPPQASPNNQTSHLLENCVLVSRRVTEQRQERVVTRTEFTSHRKEGSSSLNNGHTFTNNVESPSPRNNILIHSRSSSLSSNPNATNAPNISSDTLATGGLPYLASGNGGDNTLTRKTTTTTTVTSSERKTTNSVRDLMGPDGQQMEYSHTTRPPPPSGDYVATNQQPYANQHPHQRAHFPPPEGPFDPAMVQDPCGYSRGGLPPDPAATPSRRYNHVATGYGDYDQYPEYGSFAVGYPVDYPHHRPSTPSETSDSPSLKRNNNTEYLRGGFPPGTYDDMDSGVRPDYISPSVNAHPGNYEGGGEERGNGGPFWASNLNNTSHYGNLPVRPYLMMKEGSSGVIESTSSPQSNVVPNSNIVTFSNANHSSNSVPSQPTPPQSTVVTSSTNMQMQMDISSSGEIQMDTEALAHHHSHFQVTVRQPTATSSNDNSTNHSPGVRWRDPDLHEVIQFLGNQNPIVKANAAAYLQHLCYMDDPVKAKTRALGGIPPLVTLLSHEQPEVHRNACGALRNLSYGRQNDENKKAIKSAGGIPTLVRLLKRTPDNEVKELVTGVLWNLSSCEELKRAIIDDGIIALVNNIIIPHSGWDRAGGNSQHIPDACWSTVFKNSSGVVRNVSSAGEYARKKLRECEGLVEALLHVVRCALSRADIDDKSVENCVCILRNLSYRCQEVEDPNYDKHPPPYDKQSRAAATPAKGENLGCFGANKKKKEAALASSSSPKDSSNSVNAQGGPTRSSSQQRTEPVRGMELLWQPEVVQSYLALLSNCSNPETLEAAAGAIQNLAACYWQPSIEIRAAVRKEKGLPVLVELLRMEVDRVVCAVATALRNLALDQRNKELIGKYAMRDLVQKLPSGRPHDQNTSDDTIAAVLATLNEVIKKNAEFSRSLMEAEGVERLVLLTQQKRRFSSRVVKFASQVLYSMWQHQELREVYKKGGWTESDFIAKGAAVRSGSPGPSGNEASSAGSPVNANSTLNRPMASQSGTRYEDKTMTRGQNNVPKSPPPNYPQGEEVPLADMPYPDGGSHAPPHPGAFRLFPPQPVKPGEPLYAQVNRDKKKNRGYEGPVPNSRVISGGTSYVGTYPPSAGEHWTENDHAMTHQPGAGGDSWV